MRTLLKNRHIPGFISGGGARNTMKHSFSKKISASSFLFFLLAPSFVFFFLGAETASSAVKLPISQLVPTAEMRTPLVEEKDLDSCLTSLISGGGCSLDSIAWIAAKLLLQILFDGSMNLTRTGYGGNPIFVTNQQSYFGGVAEESTQVFLTDFRTNTPQMLPSVREMVLRELIAENYVYPKQINQSTFPGGDAAYQAYLEDPSTCPTGDPDDCRFISLRCENDPWCILQHKQEELHKKRDEIDVPYARDEILAGSGFHSLKECLQRDADGNCAYWSTYTPGEVFVKTTTETLETSRKELGQTDELDELIPLMKLYEMLVEFFNGGNLLGTKTNEVGTQGIYQGNGVTTFPLK